MNKGRVARQLWTIGLDIDMLDFKLSMALIDVDELEVSEEEKAAIVQKITDIRQALKAEAAKVSDLETDLRWK